MDSSDEENLLFLVISSLLVDKQINKKKPRFWVRSFIKERNNVGCSSLISSLQLQDIEGYQNFLRMSPQDFEEILGKVGPLIKKQNTTFRDAVSPVDQLLVTLRYLATGDSYSSLMYLSRISKTKISECIPEVCKALIKVLSVHVKMPSTSEEWSKVAASFKNRWNFPMCIGALDGKHVEIIKPANSGSDFFNYKKTFSIVLIALVDADYNFIYVNVGVQGRLSDGGVFNSTDFFRLLTNGQLGLPPSTPLPGRTVNSPYVIVADDAFALNEHLLKPYPGCQISGTPERIFNYRLSRARVVSENAFGILTAKFRVFRSPIMLCPEKATTITLACVYLHNYLRRDAISREFYTPAGTFDSVSESGVLRLGSWRNEVSQGLLGLQRVPRRDRVTAITVRNEYKDYFMTDIGSVSWQNRYA